MKYPLMIFDFDGTLADSLPFFLGAMDEVTERFGGSRIDRSALPELRKLGPQELMEKLALPAWKVPLVLTYIRRLMSQNVGSISLFPGVEELLRRLSEQGVTISIVSSNSEANVRAVLGLENAAKVAVFECGASVFGKPVKFRRVCKRTGLRPADAISVGDEIRDIEAAREVGMACGAVAWGYGDAEALRLRRPEFVFHEPLEILQLLGDPLAA